MKTSSKKQLKILSVGLMVFGVVASGLYNSVVMNSEDFMNSSDARFVKRLDELNGIVKVGRQVANQGSWVKVPSREQFKQDTVQSVAASVVSKAYSEPTSNNNEVRAAITEDLQLELVEVFNSKYKSQPSKNDFSGSMTTKDGMIEALEASLPQGEKISIQLSEMSGNVFEYEAQGQLYAGMFYELDKNSYMVTLTNGPYEGTRLKYAKSQEESSEVASNEQVEEKQDDQFQGSTEEVASNVGQFGVENMEVQTPEVTVTEVPSETNPEESVVNYGFDFSAQAEGEDNQI